MYVTQGLRRAAQVKPNAPATVFHDRRHTWREVEDRVARLAGGLLRLGLSKGGRAAILALNSDRYFEYLLGVDVAEVGVHVAWRGRGGRFRCADQHSANSARGPIHPGGFGRGNSVHR